MEHQSLGAQLQLLYKALVNSTHILYRHYSLEFKFGILLLITYLSFRLGRLTITDPIETQAKKLSQTLRNRQFYTIYLPKKLTSLGTSRKILFVLTFVIAVAAFGLYYTQNELMFRRSYEQLKLVAIALSSLPIIAIIIWLYQIILSFRMNRGGFNDRLLHDKISGILKMLGKKSQFLLKAFLSPQKYQNRPTAVNVCSKKECKEYRLLAKQKYEDIARLIDGVMSFEWCSICRKRPQFDEFLNYQGRVFSRKSVGSEQQEVTLRNQFLLGQLQRMVTWVAEINPCNCSRRYWSQSTRSIYQFKQRDKILSEKLLKLQKAKA